MQGRVVALASNTRCFGCRCDRETSFEAMLSVLFHRARRRRKGPKIRPLHLRAPRLLHQLG